MRSVDHRLLVLSRTEEHAESQLKLHGHGSIPSNRFVCFYVLYRVCLLVRLWSFIWSFVGLMWLGSFVVPLWVALFKRTSESLHKDELIRIIRCPMTLPQDG